MRLEDADVRSLTSDEFKKLAFTVDQKTAQVFFRDKMYTADGRLRVMAQEYMCNARDAHREIGKSDTPIEVTLPTTLAPEYIVRDYGPGISPERIENVFRIYGKSTKNGNDLENGGFGLGAKCAFSYTSAFALTTIHKGIKYVYSGYIDDDAMNQLILMHEGPTEEPDGTEVKISIKAADIQRFCRWVQEVTHYWQPRPVFKGRELTYTDTAAPLDQGNGWKLRNFEGISYIDSKPGIWVLADDIPYRVPQEDAKSCGHGVDRAYNALVNHGLALVLTYKVGELLIYPNREILYYLDRTKKAIALRTAQASAEAASLFQARLDSVKSVHEAVSVWITGARLLPFAQHSGTVQYGGLDLARDMSTEHMGIKVHEAYVENRSPRLCVTSYSEDKWVSPSVLLAPAGSTSRRRYVLNISNGVPSEKDIKAAMRRDGAGLVCCVSVTDPDKATKHFVDFSSLKAAGYREISKPPRAPRVKGVLGAVFMKQLRISLGSCPGGEILPEPSGVRARVPFEDISAQRFFIKTAGAGTGGGPASTYSFGGAQYPYDQFAKLVVMEQAVRKCLSLGDGEFTGVYASEWEPRFDNYIDEDETVSLVDSSLDNTRKCVLTAPLEDLMMLVDYGFLHRGVKTPERWFWGEHCYHGDKELGLILQSLRLSTLYSREFLAYAKRYLRFLRGRNSDNRRHAEALEPLYPGVLGQAGVDRLKEAVKAMNAVGDEFAFLFQKLPEIPYLFEAVAAGRNDNQRGGARSLAEFVGSLIGDRHTPGLHFSYLNDTKEEPK